MQFKLKKVELIVGGTFSQASGAFGEPIEIPITGSEIHVNDDPTRISVSRYQFIVGLDTPVFGYELDLK